MSRTRSAILAAFAATVAVAVVAGCTGTGAGAKIRAPDLHGVSEPRQAPPMPAHGAYFGAWVRQGPYTQPDQIAALRSLQRQLGRRLDIVHTYLTWGAPFPRLSEQAALSQGSMLLVSWTGTNSAAVASGRLNSAIRRRAQEIKDTHRPVFLEWRWEMDRPNLRHIVGSPADFISAWKHVRAIFAQEHVNNVAWVWCPTAKGFHAHGDASAYYPGDNEVDWVCADVYPGHGPYRSFYAVARPFLAWASHHRKPVMIGEFGVPKRYTPEHRAQWLRAAALTVRNDSQVKALVYFDADSASAPSGMAIEPGTPPMRAFRGIADSPYFNPRHFPASS